MSSLSSGGKGPHLKEWFIIIQGIQELRAGWCITDHKHQGLMRRNSTMNKKRLGKLHGSGGATRWKRQTGLCVGKVTFPVFFNH